MACFGSHSLIFLTKSDTLSFVNTLSQVLLITIQDFIILNKYMYYVVI